MRLSQPQRRSIVLVVGRPRAAFSQSPRLGSRPYVAYHSRTASIACWSAWRTAVASLAVDQDAWDAEGTEGTRTRLTLFSGINSLTAYRPTLTPHAPHAVSETNPPSLAGPSTARS
jgi:hypothetical protein